MKCKQCKKKIKENEKWTAVGLSAVHNRCLDAFIDKVIAANKEKKKKLNNEIKKAKKESEKARALKTAQASFNRYIRKRDEKKGCITCGRLMKFGDKNYHAGHFYTVGARPDLRFEEDNCFGQCADDNLFGDAETGKIFAKAVKKRIGVRRYERLKKPQYNSLTLEYLRGISKKFNKKFRELKNEND